MRGVREAGNKEASPDSEMLMRMCFGSVSSEELGLGLGLNQW